MHYRHDYNLLGSPGGASNADLQQGSQPPSPERREILREDAVRIQFSRDLRLKLFNGNMFGEPAWDILLALYIIDSDQRRLGTGELARVARVPLTTCLRWLDYLDDQSLICRGPNPLDQRVVSIELSGNGREAMDRYLTEMRHTAVFESN